MVERISENKVTESIQTNPMTSSEISYNDELVINRLETRAFLLSNGYTEEKIAEKIKQWSVSMDEDHVLAFLEYKERHKDL